MSRTPQVHVVTATPIGAAWAELDVADITFVQENGDHLHVLISRAAVETLHHHIEHIRSQTLFQPGPPPGTAEYS